MNLNKDCPVCAHQLSLGLQSWHVQCSHCGYEGAGLEPKINQQASHALIDEAAREDGLEQLRKANFARLLDEIAQVKGGGGRLLDVGCAHGWFLEMAAGRYEVTGIEPDEVVASATRARGLPVRAGYFPQVLAADERFDVIVFNDVIEHIPDIRSVLAACHHHLRDGGLLVLNLPNSDGLFYRLSRLLSRLGVQGFFERLWQKDFPSPHVHYFNPRNLQQLLANTAFEQQRGGRLETLNRKGLYTRIAYSKENGALRNGIVYLGALGSIPFLRMLPADIFFSISKKR